MLAREITMFLRTIIAKLMRKQNGVKFDIAKHLTYMENEWRLKIFKLN